MIYQKIERVNEDKVANIIQRGDELSSLIKEWEDIIWPMEGTLESFMWRLKDEDATRVQNRIQRLIAKERNELAGVAMSPQELENTFSIVSKYNWQKKMQFLIKQIN